MGTPEVVISGVGGNFPQCESIPDFFKSLKEKQSLIVTDHGRWAPGSMGFQGHAAVTKQLGYLDSYFFGIHRQLAMVTSPITRSIIEKSYEALLDAGLSQAEIFGSNTNVYMNAVDPEHESTFLAGTGYQNLAVVGASKTMTANRISYFYSFTGHSCSFTSGTWLSQALEMAHAAISTGECDMALIGGGAATIHVETLYAYNTMQFLEVDGKPKPFDANGGGAVRGDAQIIFVLQRADRARRCYATLVGAMGRPVDPRDGDILVPNNRGKDTIRELYRKCKVDPQQVQYVECTGNGYQLSDVNEITALGSVLVPNRKTPLLVGSVHGNTGYAHHGSGFMSLTKLLCILESGVIPPTVGFETPHPRMKPIIDGSIKVVTEPTEINVEEGQYYAVSEVAFHGDVGHVLLRVPPKKKKTVKVEDELPRLVLLSIRTPEGFAPIADEIHKHPFDPEYYALINEAFKSRIKGHPEKGFTICPKPEKFEPLSCTDNQEERQLWFVFSGMGSQWAGMGKDLMRLPAFRETIERCHEALLPKGLNLIDILTTSDDTIFDDILNSFVGIAAVQIGLVKLLRLMGIQPDGFIGHSVGEQACAFMDDCIDERQTILCAYARGKASNETSLVPGMMAAIGMGYDDIKKEVPPSIDVACHNSKDSCTISGPVADVEAYVEDLKRRKIFARTVNVANIAYHSRYIQNVAPHLLRRLSEVIVEPKERSSKWISTSVPEENWGSDEAKYCSPQYLTNNLLNSVLFEEGLKHVPENAVLVEVAPHGLLQAILKKSGPKNATNIALTQRKCADSLVFFLTAIGKLYLAGQQPDISKIYPPVTYPVARGTPALSNLLNWAYIKEDNHFSSNRDFKRDMKMFINIKSPCETIRGSQYCSPAHLLILVWKVLASIHKFNYDQLPVVFRNVRFLEPIELPSAGTLNLRAGIQRQSPFFEISHKKRAIVQGEASIEWEDAELRPPRPAPATSDNLATIHLEADHVYSDLAVRGHTYSASIQQIRSIDVTDSDWTINFSHQKDWDVVLSTMLQAVQLQHSEQSQLSVYPWRIRRLAIHPQKFMEAYPQDGVMYLEPKTNVVYCEGLQLQGIHTRPVTGVPQAPLTDISAVQYIPNDGRDVQSRDILRKVAVQLASEIQPLSLTIPLLHLKGAAPTAAADTEMDINELKICAEKLGIELKHLEHVSNGRPLPASLAAECLGGLVVADADAAPTAAALAAATDVLVLASVPGALPSALAPLRVLARSGSLVLLRAATHPLPKVIRMDPAATIQDFDQLPEAGSVLLWDSEPCQGIPPVIKHFTGTVDRAMMRMVFVVDARAPPFSLDEPLYRDRLALGLRVNIYKDGTWASLHNAEVATAEAGRRAAPEDHIITATSVPKISDITVKFWGLSKESQVKGKDSQFVMDYSGTASDGRNVIGVAYTKGGKTTRDSALCWPLPEGWTFEEGASVPVNYCKAYYALKILCKAEPNETILITDAYTAQGMALVRVALQLQLEILASVSKDHEHEFRNTFSKALSEDRIKIVSDDRKQLFIQVKCVKKEGMDIIVSARKQDLTDDLLSVATYFCRVVHFDGIDYSTRATLGMYYLLRSMSIFGVSSQVVANLRPEDRQAISALMSEGLKAGAGATGATVKPLNRVQLPQAITTIPWSEDTLRVRKVLSRVRHGASNAFICAANETIVLAGGTSHDNALLTSWFSARGASQIVVVADKQAAPLLLRRTRTSRNICLLTAADVHSAIERAARQGSFNTAVLVAQNCAEDKVIEQMALFKNRKGMTLVVFAGDHCVRGPVLQACEELRSAGIRTVLTAGSVETVVSTRVLDWLLRADEEPKVIHLRDAKEAALKLPAAELLARLPSDGAVMATLYGSMASKPIVREMTTVAPRATHAREVFPLFAIPSFSGLGMKTLKPLADKLLGPLFSVQLPNRVSSIKELAVQVADAIQGAQPTGPYVVLGSDWTAAVAQQVGVELAERGEAVVLFLLDAEPAHQIDELRRFYDRSDAQVLLIRATLANKATPQVLHKLASAPSWSDKMSVMESLLGNEGDKDATAASINCLTFIHDCLQALIHHKVQDSDFATHVISSGQPNVSEYTEGKNSFFCGVTESHRDMFGSPKLLAYLNSNMGYSTMKNLSDRLAAINA